MSYLVVITVPADGLAPLGAWTRSVAAVIGSDIWLAIFRHGQSDHHFDNDNNSIMQEIIVTW